MEIHLYNDTIDSIWYAYFIPVICVPNVFSNRSTTYQSDLDQTCYAQDDQIVRPELAEAPCVRS